MLYSSTGGKTWIWGMLYQLDWKCEEAKTEKVEFLRVPAVVSPLCQCYCNDWLPIIYFFWKNVGILFDWQKEWVKRQILMAVVEMFFLDKEVWLSPTKMGWLAERRARISFGCTIRQGGKGSPHGPVGLMSRRKRVSLEEESFWPITKEIFFPPLSYYFDQCCCHKITGEDECL